MAAVERSFPKVVNPGKLSALAVTVEVETMVGTARKLNVSTKLTEGVGIAVALALLRTPSIVKLITSLPNPPAIWSPALNVAELKVPPDVSTVPAAENTSSPAVLVVPAEPTRVPEVSLLVVSELFCTQNDVNTHLF